MDLASQFCYLDSMAEDSPLVRYSLRLPPELHSTLERIARDESRTLHGEILFLLRTHPDVLAASAARQDSATR